MNRFLIAVAVCTLFAACSSSSGVEQPEDGGVLPDGGGTPDGGSTPDGGVDGLTIERFESEPGALPQGGGTVRLVWETPGAESLSIDQGVGAVTGSSVEVSVTETTVFTLSAARGEGAIEESTVVIVLGDTPHPFDSGEPNAIDAIEQALADGAINDVDALRYKVFAAFGDSRLPAQFEVDGPIHGTRVFMELAARLDDLPPAVQAELRPFSLPPPDPNSWYQLERAGARASKGNPEDQFGFDSFIRFDDLGVELRWDALALSEAQEDHAINVMSNLIKPAYQKLLELMGKPPIPTGDTFRIYVLNQPNFEYPAGTAPVEYDEAKGGLSSFILVNLPKLAGLITAEAPYTESEFSAIAIAHELMHAFQLALMTKEQNTKSIPAGPANSLAWLMESTAGWAEHFVHPELDVEHRNVKHFFSVPELELDAVAGSHEYGGYLFHLYLTKTRNDEVIPAIWTNVEGDRVFEAIDGALGGELDKEWRRFTAYNWNFDRFDFYARWDRIVDSIAFRTEQEVPAAPNREQVFEIDLAALSTAGPVVGVPYLSSQYFHYVFSDLSARTVLFANGYTFDLTKGTNSVLSPFDEIYLADRLSEDDKKGAHVTALVKAGGEWLEEPYDLSEVAFAEFCQDYDEERIEELVLIFSNSRFAEGERTTIRPKSLKPQLFVSNMGCGNWKGEASLTVRVDEPGRTEMIDVTLSDLEFTRIRSSVAAQLAGAGQSGFIEPITPASSTPLGGRDFHLVEAANGTWSVFEQSQSGGDSCTSTGSGGLSASDFQGALFLTRPTILRLAADPMISYYRTYQFQLALSITELVVTTSCTQSGSSSAPFGAAIVGGLRGSDLGDFEVSNDGASMRKQWALDSGKTQLELDLTAVRQ